MDDSTLDELDRVEENAAIRLIYQHCMDAIEARAYERVSALMSRLDPAQLSVAVMLAPLSITVPVASLVDGREQYFARARAELERRGRTEAGLLGGLE